MAGPEIDTGRCIGCGKCTKVCIKDNLEIADRKVRVTEKGCMLCGHCVSVCPRGAIRLVGHRKGESDPFSYIISQIKSSRMLDGSIIAKEELEKLYSAAAYPPSAPLKDRCEFTTLSGKRLDRFMELIWEISKAHMDEIPTSRELADWLAEKRVIGPNPVLLDGNQLLCVFSHSIEDSTVSATKLRVKGATMGIGGFTSPTIIAAARAEPEKMEEFFKEIGYGKPLRYAFVIGRPRRLIEIPIPFNPFKR